MTGFSNMKGVAVGSDGRADPQSQLFRSSAVGVETGPFISQVRLDYIFSSLKRDKHPPLRSSHREIILFVHKKCATLFACSVTGPIKSAILYLFLLRKWGTNLLNRSVEMLYFHACRAA